MKKTLFIIGALLVFISAQAVNKMTLQQCIDLALANNRNVKQSELTKEKTEVTFEQARLNLLPNISAGASQGWSYGRSQLADGTFQNINSSNSSYGLSGGMTIFDGLKMKYNIDASREQMKMSEANLEKMKKDIELSVSTAFLQVLLDKELLQVAVDQLNLTNSKIEQEKSLVANGKLAEGELYEFYAEQSKEEYSKTQAENTLKLALLDLAQIMEYPDFENLDIVVPTDLMSDELQLLSPDNVYKSAVNNRPEIKSAEYQLKSSKVNVKLAKSNFFPTLKFWTNIGSGYYNSVKIPLTTGLGLNLDIPIFSKMQNYNQLRSAKMDVKSNELNVENTKLELRKTIQQDYYNAVAAKSKWVAAQKSLKANEEAYRFANLKYESGRANIYELYQAKSNLTQAKSEVVQAKYEYIFRLKILQLLK